MAAITITPALNVPDRPVVGHGCAGIKAQIQNTGGAATSITGVSFTGLVSFGGFTMSQPFKGPVPPLFQNFPFNLNAGESFYVQINFIPVLVGSDDQTLSIAWSGGPTIALIVGVGVSFATESTVGGSTRAILIAFGGTPSNKQISAGFNGAEPSTLIFNGSLWDTPGQEKTLQRIAFIYENLGVCALTGTVKVWRPLIGGSQDNFDTIPFSVVLGTAAADSTERVAYADCQATGELAELTLSRAANAGPCSIIALQPMFEPRGERIENS